MNDIVDLVVGQTYRLGNGKIVMTYDAGPRMVPSRQGMVMTKCHEFTYRNDKGFLRTRGIYADDVEALKRLRRA